ncbi:MAG: DUF72 domain-containing protein [Nitrospiraceae bacterium]|nr:MAG: DUF72 domain-containing protein [Nitrospiraceae bacterium]
MATVRIGCSGFHYSDWKGTFYPADLPQKRWFHHYCAIFPAVELNVTFYRIPNQTTFDTWHKQTPKNFAFSLKGSRFITHVKRLVVQQKSLDQFFNGALRLKKKLKVVLWQLPPDFQIDVKRLNAFISLLKKYPVKHTFEFRHKSWLTAEVLDICNRHNICLCMADWPIFISSLQITSDFVYLRRHGTGGRYDTDYSKMYLKKDAFRIEGYLNKGFDVFVFFNNDAHGYAPKNAQELTRLIHI